MEKSPAVQSFQLLTRIYMCVMVIIELCGTLFMLLAMALPFSYPGSDYPYSYQPMFFLVIYGIFVLFMLVVLAAHLYVAIRIDKPSSAVYYVALVLFAVGFKSLLTIVPAVLLFIKAFDDEVKGYYLGNDSSKNKSL